MSRSFYLLTSFALTVLLAPAGVAWAGGLRGDLERQVCAREKVLVHICQGGSNTGQECEVTGSLTGLPDDPDNPLRCEKRGCEGGECVVKYITDPVTTAPLFVSGTLSIIADDQAMRIPGAVVRTILLEFISPSGETQILANTARVTNRSEFGLATDELDDLQSDYLFRQARGAGGGFTNRLITEFKVQDSLAIPIIATIRRPVVSSDESDQDNALGTVLSFPVELGFARLRQGAPSEADPEEEE